MVNNSTNLGRFQTWNDVPVSTRKEILASKAAVKFTAETSLLEKIKRIFNGLMFSIVGAKLLFAIPGVAKLSGMAFGLIGSASFLQIPAVLAIMAIASKIIIPLAIIVVVRKVIAVVITHFVYPAVLVTLFSKREIDQVRGKAHEGLTRSQFEYRRVALNKSGIDYDAFVIEHKETKGNGKWVIAAGGNGWIGEHSVYKLEGISLAERFKEYGFNLLYVNGPGVGRSSGFPTSYSIGAGPEAGLQFLERAVKAKKIFLYGTSLGAGALAGAIENHEFRKDISYMAWSDRAFDTLSNAASAIATIMLKPLFSRFGIKLNPMAGENLIKPLFFLLGIELNTLAGAKKLEREGITHIVTQNCEGPDTDGILPLGKNSDGLILNQASLYNGLIKAGMRKSERLKCYGNSKINHNGELPETVQNLVKVDVLAFAASVA